MINPESVYRNMHGGRDENGRDEFGTDADGTTYAERLDKMLTAEREERERINNLPQKPVEETRRLWVEVYEAQDERFRLSDEEDRLRRERISQGSHYRALLRRIVSPEHRDEFARLAAQRIDKIHADVENHNDIDIETGE